MCVGAEKEVRRYVPPRKGILTLVIADGFTLKVRAVPLFIPRRCWMIGVNFVLRVALSWCFDAFVRSWIIFLLLVIHTPPSDPSPH
jgi:hypothetical protein